MFTPLLKAQLINEVLDLRRKLKSGAKKNRIALLESLEV
jgi:hypothetical protein